MSMIVTSKQKHSCGRVRIITNKSLSFSLTLLQSNSAPYNKYAYLTARDLYSKHRYIHRAMDNIRRDVGDKSRVTEQLNVRPTRTTQLANLFLLMDIKF